MSLLKPSQLRKIIDSLNSLLQEYSVGYKDISGRYRDELMKRQRQFEKDRNDLNSKGEQQLRELEEEFESQRTAIELATTGEIKKFQTDVESRKNSLTKEFEENSETVRRYSREDILEKRKLNEENIENLKAEFISILDIVEESETLCLSLEPVLKKFGGIREAEDLIDGEFDTSDDAPPLGQQMAEADISPYFDRLSELNSFSSDSFRKLQKSPLTSLFMKIHPAILLILITIFHVGLYFLGDNQKIDILSMKNITLSFAVTGGLTVILLLIHKLTTTSRLAALSKNHGEIQGLCYLCRAITSAQLDQEVASENKKLTEFSKSEDQRINTEVHEVEMKKKSELRQLKDDFHKKSSELDLVKADEMEKLATIQTEKLEALEDDGQNAMQELLQIIEEDKKEITGREQQELDTLLNRWQKQWVSKLEEFEELNKNSCEKEKVLFPAWSSELSKWEPPFTFDGASPFGTLKMDLKKELTFPEDGAVEFNDSVPFSIPALLEFPGAGSLLATTKDEGHDMAVELLQNTVLRLMMTLPPGKARFSFIDPLALGETFAGFMHLNDFKEDLTGGRIATNSRQIEQQLADLNEHMENVIQKYLRNEFKDICDYNEEVGEIAEPFRFLVINDFPVNFSEDAVRRLVSIAKSGARCGVYLIMHRDQRHSIPGDFDISDIEQSCCCIEYLFGDLDWRNCGFKLADFYMEKLPQTASMNEIIKKIGSASIDATRVEIPFTKIQQQDKWSHSSADDIKAAIGLTGARQQEITFGHGTNQHCLIAGKTGSGKSNLMHVIICNMALNYSPEELEFYLIDFKKGVEFKPYASLQLPHARAIAIESDREFGLSVLRRIDEDLKERGETLRAESVQNISQYRSSTGKKMARILLVIDEFQELFVEDDMVSQEASLLLDRIVRQGRAFGIHVILGSQTLTGSYSLPRSTMGQMTIRIALQCSESDSYAILSENNSAARLLGRPGEAIYNNNAGLPEGNNPFQTAYLPENEKDLIIRDLAAEAEFTAYVFEGNIPADLKRCGDFKNLLNGETAGKPQVLLGEPNAIRPAQSISFESMAGQNLLIVGQKEENSLSILTSSIFSLALNCPQASFYIFDGSSADKPREDHFTRIKDTVSNKLIIVKPNEASDSVGVIHKDIQDRLENGSESQIFIFIHGIQRFRKLKQEDSFSWDEEEKSPGAMLAEVLKDGPENKVHTICWADSWNSLNRMMPRKSISEFEYRILFQMGQSDSVSLIDCPEAAKLGLHTSLLFNDQTGDMLKFRSFSLPESEVFEKVSKAQQGSVS